MTHVEDRASIVAWLHASFPGRPNGDDDEADDGLVHMAELAEVTHWAGGMFIHRKTEPSCHVYFVYRGLAERSVALGDRRVVVDLIHEGGLFGDIPALSGSRYRFDARLVRDSVLLRFRAEDFARCITSHQGLGDRWRLAAAARIESADERIAGLLHGSLEARLAAVLFRENAYGPVEVPQAKLADLLGARRTSVNRALQALASEGIVELSYRNIRVLDAADLEQRLRPDA